mgnify:CR=1 FL=1
MALTVDNLRCPQNHRCPLLLVCPVGAITQSGFGFRQSTRRNVSNAANVSGTAANRPYANRQTMEKLCRIRELQRAVNRFEAALERSHGICLNEGMALCSLSKAGRLSCGELGEMLGLTPSNTSKVLRSVEGKGYVNRELGTNDKRQIYFSLTEKGRGLLGSINCEEIETPELLKTLFGE